LLPKSIHHFSGLFFASLQKVLIDTLHCEKVKQPQTLKKNMTVKGEPAPKKIKCLAPDKLGLHYKSVALLDVLFADSKLDIVTPKMQGFERYPYVSLQTGECHH